MNHRKAMPANGTRLRLSRIMLRRWASSWSDSRPPSANAIRDIVRAAMSSTPKMIPAIAAARRLRHSRGVRTGEPVVIA